MGRAQGKVSTSDVPTLDYLWGSKICKTLKICTEVEVWTADRKGL